MMICFVAYVVGVNMGQFEIYEFLKQHPGKWWNTKEISEAINMTQPGVSNGLRRLLKFKHVYLKKEIQDKTSHLIILTKFRK